MFFEPGGKLLGGLGVQDLAFYDTGSSSDPDAVFHQVEVTYGVSVGIDHDHDPGLGCGCSLEIVEIQASGIGVDFQAFAVFFGCLDDRSKVELVGRSAGDQPTRGMGDRVHASMGDRADDSVCDFLPGLFEPEMDACSHPVGFS